MSTAPCLSAPAWCTLPPDDDDDFGFPDILFDILFGFELFSMIGVRRPPCASPAALHATGRVLSARVCLHRGGQGEDYDHPWQRPRRGRRRGPRRAATDRLQVPHCTCAGAAEELLERLERRERRLKANDGRRARLLGRAGARTGLGRAMGRREGESTGVRGLCVTRALHVREVCFYVLFRARAIRESVLWRSRTLYIESFQ